MFGTDRLTSILQAWNTLLGDRMSIGTEQVGRELWPVIAADGTRYFLKRLGPWRNLPVADEARILRWTFGHYDALEEAGGAAFAQQSSPG